MLCINSIITIKNNLLDQSKILDSINQIIKLVYNNNKNELVAVITNVDLNNYVIKLFVGIESSIYNINIYYDNSNLNTFIKVEDDLGYLDFSRYTFCNKLAEAVLGEYEPSEVPEKLEEYTPISEISESDFLQASNYIFNTPIYYPDTCIFLLRRMYGSVRNPIHLLHIPDYMKRVLEFFSKLLEHNSVRVREYTILTMYKYYIISDQYRNLFTNSDIISKLWINTITEPQKLVKITYEKYNHEYETVHMRFYACKILNDMYFRNKFPIDQNRLVIEMCRTKNNCLRSEFAILLSKI